jgi:DNA-binding NarL/FixJ family response regulator
MLAEDRVSMRHALKGLLQTRSGWEVCGEAEDADEAFAKALELRPDLIVMDYRMYHSDGLEAADRILRELPEMPIVMFTLYKTNELEHSANLMGIRYVVGKEEGAYALLCAIEAELNNKVS